MNLKEIIFIAEIGSNHDGDLSKALELIDAAAESGAHIIKFQSWLADDLVLPNNKDYALLRKLQMPRDWLPVLKERCEKHNKVFLSTATNETTLKWLEEINVEGYKLPSGNITHAPLIEEVLKINKPLIISVGAATLNELVNLKTRLINSSVTEFAFLHCVSKYPAEPDEMKLGNIGVLKDVLGCPVGLSDHTEGISISIAAAALGANIFERHISIDKKGISPDHSFALLPDQFALMCREIINIKESCKVDFTIDNELRAGFLRSIHLVNSIRCGDVINFDDIKIVRPNTGLAPDLLAEVIGKKASRDIQAYEPLLLEDIESS